MRVRLDWLDEQLASRVLAIAAGELTPAAPRNAATVIVARDAAGAGGGIEVLMMKRPAAMRFAAGAYVFPGGSVDRADYQADAGPARIGWHGPDAAEFGRQLGVPAGLAHALVCAAVRETFEEAGILLAGTPDGRLAAPRGPDWDADRTRLTAAEITLADLLGRRGLVLRADLLTPWARWITPEAEPRRFDAWFFAAALPAGQTVRGHPAEADAMSWLRPAAALDAARGGELSLLPPTATTLAELAEVASVAGILGRKRAVAPVQPVLVSVDGQAWLEIPDDLRYPL